MVSAIFNTFFYDPIYNVLVALMAFAPGGDVGFAVIALTVLIRLALLPLSLSAARSQRAMRALEPKLQEIKEKHGENREEYAKKTLELYRTEGVNPFSGIVSIFVQLPVLFALYWVFLEPFATLDIARVYSFTPTPDAISGSFLGLIDLASKSIVLAVLAGVTHGTA
jgi:YidC/Oxa1 family membrane protein insertase